MGRNAHVARDCPKPVCGGCRSRLCGAGAGAEQDRDPEARGSVGHGVQQGRRGCGRRDVYRRRLCAARRRADGAWPRRYPEILGCGDAATGRRQMHGGRRQAARPQRRARDRLLHLQEQGRDAAGWRLEICRGLAKGERSVDAQHGHLEHGQIVEGFMPKTYRVAVIAGDGIGKEVVPEGIQAMEAAARRYGFGFEWKEFDWSCETYAKTGRMMPEDGIEQLKPYDSVFLGAVGYPGVPDHISLWGLLIPLRREFQQYINLRPIRLLAGVDCPLKNRAPGDIDFYVVRENNEGEYSSIGGRVFVGTENEMAMQEAVFTKRGCDRVMRYAFELAKGRKKHVTSATKSNGIIHTMPYWDERFAAIAKEYPGFTTDQYHIDILTAHFVRHPDWFDVVVGSNLFGDILSDLGPACVGSIGIAPSANINPEREFPSMFEPVHGSAPDIAGRGVANPIGQIWSGAMMLDHFGESAAAQAVERAIAEVLADGGTRTPDLGGNAGTKDLGAAVTAAIR